MLLYDFESVTLVNGVNGHGKTELVGHIAIEAMSQEIRTCIASLELKPGKMLARLTRQTICTSSPKREEIVMTNEWFSDRLWVFKLTGTAKAGRLLEIFAYARRRYGIDLFVIDIQWTHPGWCGTAGKGDTIQ